MGLNLSSSTSNVSVTAGSSTTVQYQISWSTQGSSLISDAAPIPAEATITVTGLPRGITPKRDPATINPSIQKASIMLIAAPTAPPGGPTTFYVTATDRSGKAEGSLGFQLTVKPGFYTANGSVTFWNLITGNAMDLASPNELATAPVRDPLWMLARQWQLKEFSGIDAGSAIQVRYLAEQTGVNRYIGGSGKVSAFDEQISAMESAVESETVNLQLRGAMQLGLRFEAMLTDAQANLGLSAAGLTALIAQFRSAFPTIPPSSTALYDIRTNAYAALAAGSVTNGWALYQLASTQPNSSAIPAGAGQVVQAFVKWCTGLYVQPGADPAWNAERVTYNFGAASAQPAATVIMKSPDFPGGRLDWYDFDFAGSDSNSPATPSPAPTTLARTAAALLHTPGRYQFPVPRSESHPIRRF